MLSDQRPSFPESAYPSGQSDHALVLVNASGRISRLNAAAAVLAGRPGAELAGMPIDEVLRLANGEAQPPAQWWQSLQGDTPVELMGAPTPMALIARTQVLDGGGASWCLLSLRSGVNPEENRTWLDSFEVAFEGELNGRFLAVSQSFARKFGQAPHSWSGGEIASIMHPDDVAPWAVATRMLGCAPFRTSCDVRMRTPQGWRWINWALSAARNVDGNIVGFRATGCDVTKRRLAEEQYRRLCCAGEQSPVAFLITDSDGRVQYVNRKFTETNGFSLEDIMDRELDPLRAGHRDDESFRKFWETLRTKGIWRGELSTKHPGGRTIWESVQASLIRNEDGEVTNVVCLREDITEQKFLEEQLRQSQKMEGLGTLAGGIAHDFNNMLAVVTGYAEICLGRAAGQDELLRKYLREIHSASLRACGLVRQILTFSRKTEVRFAPVSLAQLVQELAQLFGETFPRRITLDLELDESLPDLRGDQNQLQQVVMNLCVNARDAMPEGGTLTLALRRVSGQELGRFGADPTLYYARLDVADTGTGMTPEVRERAFDPFFTTKRPGEGSGMGLAVVDGIVRDYGGAISVVSEEGKGSTFTVYLPRVASEEPSSRAAPVGPPRGSERILLLDDELVQVQSVRAMLSKLGYEVVALTDGQEALTRIRADPQAFDLLITDQTMPHLTGVQLAKEVLGIRPDLPIILCTGFSEAVDANEARALGIREFLMKPYSVREMAETVRRALSGKLEKKP